MRPDKEHQLITLTTKWADFSKVMVKDMIKIQDNHFWAKGHYLPIARFIFVTPEFNYTMLDDVFDLDPHLNNLEYLLGKLTSMKHKYERHPAAVIVCIPILARNDDGQHIKGYLMFHNKELSSSRKFYGFNGINSEEMSHINKKLILPDILAAFVSILPYDIMKN